MVFKWKKRRRKKQEEKRGKMKERREWFPKRGKRGRVE